MILPTLSLVVDAYCFPLVTDRGLICATIAAAMDTATKGIAYQLWTSMSAALASLSALHGVNTCYRMWDFFTTTRQAKLFRLVEVGVSGGLDGDLSPSIKDPLLQLRWPGVSTGVSCPDAGKWHVELLMLAGLASKFVLPSFNGLSSILIRL